MYLPKSELHLPSPSLRNERREYLNKSDGGQPSNQVSLAIVSLPSFPLVLTMSPANLLASFLRQGQMGAARGAAGMRHRAARKDADTAQPPAPVGPAGAGAPAVLPSFPMPSPAAGFVVADAV